MFKNSFPNKHYYLQNVEHVHSLEYLDLGILVIVDSNKHESKNHKAYVDDTYIYEYVLV